MQKRKKGMTACVFLRSQNFQKSVAEFCRFTLVDTHFQPSKVTAASRVRHSSISTDEKMVHNRHTAVSLFPETKPNVRSQCRRLAVSMSRHLFFYIHTSRCVHSDLVLDAMRTASTETHVRWPFPIRLLLSLNSMVDLTLWLRTSSGFTSRARLKSFTFRNPM